MKISQELRSTAAMTMAVCVGGAVAYLSVLYGNHIDLDTFTQAATDLLAGQSPYRPGEVPFVYPPAGLLVASLSLGGGAMWAAASVVALARTVWVLVRVGWPALDRARVVERAGWIFVAVVVLEPTLTGLAYGQVGLFLLWMVVEGVLSKPGSPRGLLLGFAAAAKLTPVYLVTALALARSWRAVWWAVAGAAASTAIAVALDPAALTGYLDGGHRLAVEANLMPDTQDHSIAGLVRALGIAMWAWAAAAAMAAVIGLVAASRLMRQGDLLGGLAAALVASLLVSPISWTHHWVAAYPAFVVLLRDRGRRPMRLGLLAVAFLGWLLMLDRLGPLTNHLSDFVVDVPAGWTLWQEWPVFWGLAYVGYALTMRPDAQPDTDPDPSEEVDIFV